MAQKLSVAPVPSRKVLLVDREHDVQGPLIVKLRQAGFETLTARRGKDAIAIAEHENLAIVIIDPRLQDMSGARVGSMIRERFGISFLFLTERSTDNYESAAYEAGATNILSKQTHPVDLATQIQMAIRQADELASAKKQNQDLHRRIDKTIHQEAFIGALMEQWNLDRSSVRKIIQQFARRRRVSVDDLAGIYSSKRETIQRLKDEYLQRVAEVEPDILVELNQYRSNNDSLFTGRERAREG